jgi:hypothetical protein
MPDGDGGLLSPRGAVKRRLDNELPRYAVPVGGATLDAGVLKNARSIPRT